MFGTYSLSIPPSSLSTIVNINYGTPQCSISIPPSSAPTKININLFPPTIVVILDPLDLQIYNLQRNIQNQRDASYSAHQSSTPLSELQEFLSQDQEEVLEPLWPLERN